MENEIFQADVIEWAESYKGPKFHAMFCDPPYHLTTITKRFGKNGSAPAQYGQDGAFQRASRGFMGQEWDGGDVAFRPETWTVLAEHLYPGAFGMAFAGSRGQHRMAVAIEDAGLIIHPMIGWVYGSGFCKATRIDTQIDRDAGAEREIIGKGTSGEALRMGGENHRPWHKNYKNGDGKIEFNITAPKTDFAKIWAGRRYGLQALKPALEPIIVFQKPYEGRPVDCITETGAGALNIDGCRIETEELTPRNNNNTETILRKGFEGSPKIIFPSERGRWPSNLILQHHPGCGEICHPDCSVKMLADQAGILKSGTGSFKKDSAKGYSPNICGAESRSAGTPNVEYGDEGTADRYFYQADWSYEIYERLMVADPIQYQAKPTRHERDCGLEDLPLQTRNRVNAGGLENEPRWAPTEAHNDHPTVKPIKLCQYLCKLLLPPDAYAPRRILVPFAGSGSEMIGATLAGWDEVTGIEQSGHYVTLAEHRLAWWQRWLADGQDDVETVLQAARKEKEVTDSGQQRLF